jgi:hypothetical protein
LLRPLVQMGDRLAKQRAENLEANNQALSGLNEQEQEYERIAREALQNNHG